MGQPSTPRQVFEAGCPKFLNWATEQDNAAYKARRELRLYVDLVAQWCADHDLVPPRKRAP